MKTNTPLLPKLWTAIPDAIRNRLGCEAGPQRAMFEDDHLLIILHQIPQANEATRSPALFWRLPDGSWKSTPASGGLAALNNHLNGFSARLDELDDAEQAAQSAAAYHQVLGAITPVLRCSRGLHRALQQAREAVKTDRELINARDQAVSIERNADLLLQDAQLGLNFVMARQAEQQAENSLRVSNTAHRLNVLAAIFLPLTALTGLFGMNLHGPLANTLQNFWLVTAIGVVTGLVVSSMMLSRR
jgi:uncharacterized membrane protein